MRRVGSTKEESARESEEEEGEEKETAAVDATKIAALLGTFFVVWCFCSPASFPHLQVQKRKES